MVVEDVSHRFQEILMALFTNSSGESGGGVEVGVTTDLKLKNESKCGGQSKLR